MLVKTKDGVEEMTREEFVSYFTKDMTKEEKQIWLKFNTYSEGE